MAYTENKKCLVDSLLAAIKAHGAPNRFRCSELADEYRAPGPMICGIIGKRYSEELSVSIGRKVEYEKGWFIVS